MHMRFAVTRFDNETWAQNYDYRQSKNIDGCVYGVPSKITENIQVDEWVCVIEMNNETNQVMGIGLIKNYLKMEKRNKIYDEQYYNNYTYVGKQHLNRNEIQKQTLDHLECMLFYGKGHLKRGKGIQQIPASLIETNIHTFKNIFQDFQHKYQVKIQDPIKCGGNKNHVLS